MKVAVVGGGITGMSAAHELSKRGIDVTIFEKDEIMGGLAGSFKINGAYLEKFYHHLFNTDLAMVGLIEELGLADNFEWHDTNTGLYYVNRIFRLASPLDVLRFNPLNLVDRVRLGSLAILPRFVRDWRKLEQITAKDWVIKMGGRRVFEAVWEPLLRSKFGRYYDQVAAVWFWNKLVLRAGSRGRGAQEQLGYQRGGFGPVLEAWEAHLRQVGVVMHTQAPVEEVRVEGGKAIGVVSNGELHRFDRVIVTTAPALFADVTPALPADYAAQMRSIIYLANVCLVLKLKRSLSSTYWLNIADPTIPFVGVIEHTNMLPPDQYGGAHIAYLSRYLDPDDPYYNMPAEELFASYLPHLEKMFPEFDPAWITQMWAWRERWTQPVILLNYSKLRPQFETPIENLWLSCMASIYPQDRGTNYAVVYGKRVVQAMLGEAPAEEL